MLTSMQKNRGSVKVAIVVVLIEKLSQINGGIEYSLDPSLASATPHRF